MTKPIDEERPDDTAETALGADGHSTDSGGDVEVGPSGASEFSAAKSGGDVEVAPSGGSSIDSGGDVEVGPSGGSSIDSGGDVEVAPDQPA
jgi:hypothetical protein